MRSGRFSNELRVVVHCSSVWVQGTEPAQGVFEVGGSLVIFAVDSVALWPLNEGRARVSSAGFRQACLFQHSWLTPTPSRVARLSTGSTT